MATVDALHLLTGAVHTLAGVAPVPGLAAAFTVFHFICSCVRTIRVRQKQLAVLSNVIAQLLSTLQQEFEANRLVPISCVQPLHNLHQLLNDIHKFVQAEKDRSFFKAILLHTAASQVSVIDMFYHRIATATSSFQISSALNIQHMLHDNEQARLADVSALAERFEILEKNHDELRRELDVNNKNIVAIMVSIERRMDRSQNHMNASEQKFYSHTLQYLASTSGQHIELEDWMISPFDVDINIKIGAGGFGTVFKGTWNHTDVAIKMIHNDSGITADISMLRHEIDIWMTLRHPNILQFLGANTMDDKPFVVMPLLPHNAREFLRGHPDKDPLFILRDIALGLEYLHGRKICHGDLKGINVLVEESGRALLCDFGLTRLKADINSRTRSNNSPAVSGSRNWMAPELLTGSLPKPSTDIYALGMTIYELYTDQVPLHLVAYGDFVELVFKQDVRPEQPEEDEFPNFTGSIWGLAEHCWQKNPKDRPTAQQIHDMIKVLLPQRSTVKQPQNLETLPLYSPVVPKTAITVPKELETMNPKLHHELTQLLDTDITTTGGIFFTTTEQKSGVAVSTDLIPNGSTITVTEHHKREYVNAMVSHCMAQFARNRAALKEVEAIDSQLYHELSWMLDNDITDVLTDLTFTAIRKKQGKVISQELMPNGRNIAVTESNKLDYVNEIVSHCLMEHSQRVETVNNAKFIDSKLRPSLKWMLENNVTGRDGGFTITDTHTGKLVELVPNGHSIPVTEKNKFEFIDAVVEYFQDLQTRHSQQGKKARKWYHF